MCHVWTARISFFVKRNCWRRKQKTCVRVEPISIASGVWEKFSVISGIEIIKDVTALHFRCIICWLGGWGHVGYVYQASNFLYTGLTKPRTDKYADGGHSRHHQIGETRRQQRTAKHRYVFLVGNRKERKEMRKQLRYPVLTEYPKGDSRHYDIFNPRPVIECNEPI